MPRATATSWTLRAIGAAGIERERERHDPVPAQQAERRLQTHDSVRRRGPADRTAGVRPESQERVAGRDRRAGAARGAGGSAGGIVGVPRDAAEGAHRPPGSELAQVHLRQHDRSGAAEPLHEEGVVRRQPVPEQEGAGGGPDIRRVEVVLQDHGDAVERGAPAGSFPLGVELAGSPPGLRVQRDHGVDRRPLIVVGGDPRETELDQPLGIERPGVHGVVDLGDRRRGQIELALTERRHTRGRGERRQENEPGEAAGQRELRGADAHGGGCYAVGLAGSGRPPIGTTAERPRTPTTTPRAGPPRGPAADGRAPENPGSPSGVRQLADTRSRGSRRRRDRASVSSWRTRSRVSCSSPPISSRFASPPP